MQEYRFDNQETLSSLLSEYDDRFLFRGQTKHYMSHDGSPQLCTSFSRKGCVPPTMFRWAFYAREILRAYGLLGTAGSKDHHAEQALLQHYGWRSFFIDFTSSVAVASWFASNSFSQKTTICLSNDCFDIPLLLGRDLAVYTEHTGDGHLYVVEKSSAMLMGNQSFDLCSTTVGKRFRAQLQSASLLGPIPQEQNGVLNPRCIVAHISAPSNVLAEFARIHGLRAQSDVFPNSNDDAILRYFEAIPWDGVESSTKSQGPLCFVRGLRIPEYDFSLKKWEPETSAFYTPYWIAHKRPRHRKTVNPFRKALFIKASASIYFGDAFALDTTLPHVRKLIELHEFIVIETEHMILLPAEIETTAYTKGVVIMRESNERVMIGELIIDHPGSKVAGIGITVGYMYRLDGARLRRVPDQQDCSCGNEYRHRQHLVVLAGVEWALTEKRSKKVRKYIMNIW